MIEIIGYRLKINTRLRKIRNKRIEVVNNKNGNVEITFKKKKKKHGFIETSMFPMCFNVPCL